MVTPTVEDEKRRDSGNLSLIDGKDDELQYETNDNKVVVEDHNEDHNDRVGLSAEPELVATEERQSAGDKEHATTHNVGDGDSRHEVTFSPSPEKLQVLVDELGSRRPAVQTAGDGGGTEAIRPRSKSLPEAPKVHHTNVGWFASGPSKAAMRHHAKKTEGRRSISPMRNKSGGASSFKQNAARSASHSPAGKRYSGGPSKAAVRHANAVTLHKRANNQKETTTTTSSSVKGKKVKATPKELRRASSLFAEKTCSKMFLHSEIEDKSDSFPKYNLEELQLGRLLGKGGFGTVKEIRSFSLTDSCIRKEQEQRRKFLSQHCMRNGKSARYAVKSLSPDVKLNHIKYAQGLMDMAVEARFLSSLEHPNIIKIRAMAMGSKFGNTFFIIMDRLYDTLERRIVRRWAKQSRLFSSLVGKAVADRDGSKQNALLEERILTAYELASAFTYLHDKRILYRDIKSENIGYDVRGDIKLFDFGLAKEITPQIEKTRTEAGCYKLTGDTGSLRYMAPEVAKSLSYNEKCDVYSFAILLWEMLACKTPFEGYVPRMMREKVFKGDHKRPLIDEAWPVSLKTVLRRGWSPDVVMRMSMLEVEDLLKKELIRLRGGDVSGLDQVTRRSTFVFDVDDEDLAQIQNEMEDESEEVLQMDEFHHGDSSGGNRGRYPDSSDDDCCADDSDNNSNSAVDETVQVGKEDA